VTDVVDDVANDDDASQKLTTKRKTISPALHAPPLQFPNPDPLHPHLPVRH